MVFEIFMMVGWTLFGLIMLSLWADMREMKQDLKTYRRDLMRNQLGGRTSENYPGFSEEEYWRSAREEMVLEEESVPYFSWDCLISVSMFAKIKRTGSQNQSPGNTGYWENGCVTVNRKDGKVFYGKDYF